MSAGSECLKEFLIHIKDPSSVVGYDAQYKNNKERLPVWIVCAQSHDFSTVLGFVIITEDSTEEVLKDSLDALENYLNQLGIGWSSYVMIDKSEEERDWKAISSMRVPQCKNLAERNDETQYIR